MHACTYHEGVCAAVFYWCGEPKPFMIPYRLHF
jgi:hypothetical protein